MVQWMLVFAGGGLGSMLRYAFSLYIAPFSYASRFFPLATLFANIVSCFILGLLINKYVHDGLSTDARLLFATGFCGGFSTFSTLSLEMLRMIENGQTGMAFFYITLTTLAGLVFLYLGYKLTF
jgi:fluoride exporter